MAGFIIRDEIFAIPVKNWLTQHRKSPGYAGVAVEV